ncbi:MAG TPA: YsnF/AvaK domain-containing protein [Nitrososphaera sp.]|nr:YsnF/AvaK domain-containing protein [Nitrososphaera sp.]
MTSSTDEQQPAPPSSFYSITDWVTIVGKNVKTVDYQDAGKVIYAVENEDTIIISYESPHSNYKYRVPKRCVQGFNDPDVLLSITRAELADYEISDIQDYAAQLRSVKTEQKGGGEEEEITVPVIEEKLNVSKNIVTDEAIIIKEPITETKIIQISLMHEEVVLEKRPPGEGEGGDTNRFEDPPPRNTRTQIRVPLIHEIVKVKKEPYVKEEIIIKKEPRTETKTVSEFVTKEKVDTGNNNTIAQAS